MMRHVAVEGSIDQIGENRKAEAERRAANTPSQNHWLNSCVSRSKRRLTDSRAVYRCRCRSVTFVEADNRLAAGWHVNLPEPGPMYSAQRKRYLRLERERLLALRHL